MSEHDREWEEAKRAVTRAAVAIERAVATMLATTNALESVAHGVVVERLMLELIERNPEALSYLTTYGFGSHLPGDATIRLTNG